MTVLAIVIALPEHWNERQAKTLTDRLCEKELPPGLDVALGIIRADQSVFDRVLQKGRT